MRESIDALAAEGGTATGEAIAASLRSLERARGPRGKNPAAIILLSDGFSTSGRDPLEAAREARRKGIRVYTVSLGTPPARSRSNAATAPSASARSHPTPRPCARSPASPRAAPTAPATGSSSRRSTSELGDQVGTRKEKRQVTSAFAGGALLLLGAGGLMSLRFFGRLP